MRKRKVNGLYISFRHDFVASPNKLIDGLPNSSFKTSTSLKAIIPLQPVPNALKNASLAAKRAA